MQLGLAAAKAGQPARARRYFDQVLRMQPANLEACLQRAEVAADPREAMSFLARALEIDPGYLPAQMSRVAALRRLGRNDEAEEAARAIARRYRVSRRQAQADYEDLREARRVLDQSAKTASESWANFQQGVNQSLESLRKSMSEARGLAPRATWGIVRGKDS